MHDNFILTYECFWLGLLTRTWLRCSEDTQKENADDINMILHFASDNKLRATQAASLSA
jgi:hypothetical protein